MKSSTVCIHVQPEFLPKVKELGYKYKVSDQFGPEEIDVFVEDVPYEMFDGTYQDPDEVLCEFYNIDYSYVNNIELA